MDFARVCAVLDKLNDEAGVEVVIEGGAPGADRLAREWSRMVAKGGPDVETFEADWENHGSFAGPMRNARMLAEGRPDVVVAFPGGRGTADMVKKARRAGVEVIEIAP
jgi:hypothetical protein